MSKFSIKDKLAKSVAPLKRQLVDKVVGIEGVPTNVLKVTTKKTGMSGDKIQTFSFSILNDVIMRFPVNEMEMLESLNAQQQVSVNALDLWELLPTIMICYFRGDIEKEATSVKIGDIIVYVLYDENDNKIPILFTVSRPMGRFLAGKYLVKRQFELAKYRGVPEDNIQVKIDEYLNNLE